MISVKVIQTTELTNGDLEVILEYNPEFAKFLRKKYKRKRISAKLIQNFFKEALEQYVHYQNLRKEFYKNNA